jgi:hypothetical protein
MSARLTPQSPAARAASRERMLRQRADPAYIAKIQAGRQAGAKSTRHTPPPAEERAAARDRMVKLNADPKHRKRSYYTREAKRRGLDVELPPWVPLGLVPDFLDFACDFGEIDAAMRVRSLMREARE